VLEVWVNLFKVAEIKRHITYILILLAFSQTIETKINVVNETIIDVTKNAEQIE
jgi:hypothetical protein